MLHFLIRPMGQSEPVELIAQDETALLPLLERLHCSEAEVHRDGVFAFTARRIESGAWQIAGSQKARSEAQSHSAT